LLKEENKQKYDSEVEINKPIEWKKKCMLNNHKKSQWKEVFKKTGL